MTVEAIAIAFSGIVLLALIKVTVENRDELREIKQALFGVPSSSEPSGLVHQAQKLASTFDAHYQEEREFWDEVKEHRLEMRREVVNAATAVVSAAQLDLAKQIDEIRGRLAILAERRLETRPQERGT